MAVFLRLIVGLDHLQIMAGGSNILGAQIFQALGAVHILLALAGTSSSWVTTVYVSAWSHPLSEATNLYPFFSHTPGWWSRR